MKKVVWKIKNSSGKRIKVYPKLVLYKVKDIYGTSMYLPGIELETKKIFGYETYGFITKSFGEFVGVKNAVLIDTNNFPYITQLLDLGIARDTGYTRTSGFWRYPLWEFDEELLRSIGPEAYDAYSKRFDEYLNL